MVLQRYRLAAAFMVVALALTGPIFASDKAPAVNKKVVKKTAYGAPETHALIYGLVSTPKKFGKDPKVVGMEFFQMNPAMEPMIVSPGRDGKVFYFQPLPIGAQMFLRCYQFGEGKKWYFVDTHVNEGILNFEVTKPGLIYLGTYINGLTEKSGLGTMLFGRSEIEFKKAETEEESAELKALKAVRSSFTKTPWEPLIEKRIQELDK